VATRPARSIAGSNDSLAAYAERLRQDADEVNTLFRDLLIGVTNFFRDAKAFEALEQLVMPRLFEGKGPSDTIRVWVPGCATGEEVYSLAILAREQAEQSRSRAKIQIFATDIDEAALAVARAGRYPDTLLHGVSKERLERFLSPRAPAMSSTSRSATCACSRPTAWCAIRRSRAWT
jgi:two-component system CheB/CheR fusion protein